MPAYVEQNVFGHTRSLPGWFWNGRTRMRCLAHAIGQSLEQAYAHHIQRLMVIGNFALLAGLDPVAVHRWYLGVYVDAFEWVELPNTVGMNQFADGGLFIAHHARFNLTTLAPEGSATVRALPCGTPFGFIPMEKRLLFARHSGRLPDRVRKGTLFSRSSKNVSTTVTIRDGQS
jgi:hypothetical protein